MMRRVLRAQLASRFGLAASVVTGAILLTFVGVAFGSSGGISGYSGHPGISGGATCATCHTGGVAPAVSIAGPTTVTAGSTSNFTLTISGGQAVGGGFGLSATGGSLVATAADTRLVGAELVQAGTKTADGAGVVSWNFGWTAPATAGTVTLYAAGNSVDGDGGTGGDATTLASITITVTAAANQVPTANPGGPYTGVVQQGITFDGTGSTDPDGSIASYRWDFGDGSAVVDFGTASAILQHSYPATGTYIVTLTVVDDAGAPHAATTSATVSDGTAPPPPTVPPSTTTTTTTTTGAPTTTTTAAPGPVDGWALYGQFCAGCHGGSGQGGAGPSLQVSTSSRSSIVSAIANGVGTMPGFSAMLSTEEISAIASVTRSMQSPTATTTTAAPLSETATGVEIYAASCAGGHGPAGEGSAVGPSLIDAPLAAPVLRAITVNGSEGMPGFADELSDGQIDRVVDFVVGLAGGATEDEDADDDDEPAVPLDPATALYMANCASCHGEFGGGGTAGPIDREWDDAELIDLIATGPSTMPAFSDILSDEEIAMVAGHVQTFTAPVTDGSGDGEGGFALITPAGPTDQSLELVDRLESLGAPDGADGRSGFPTWIALLVILVSVAAAVAWIRMGRIGALEPAAAPKGTP